MIHMIVHMQCIWTIILFDTKIIKSYFLKIFFLDFGCFFDTLFICNDLRTGWQVAARVGNIKETTASTGTPQGPLTLLKHRCSGSFTANLAIRFAGDTNVCGINDFTFFYLKDEQKLAV